MKQAYAVCLKSSLASKTCLNATVTKQLSLKQTVILRIDMQLSHAVIHRLLQGSDALPRHRCVFVVTAFALT